MRTTQQINSFWDLARERSDDGETLRRRMAAVGAIAIVFCGFLLAIGLGLLVVAFLTGTLLSLAAVALVAAWPRIRSAGRDGARHACGWARGARSWAGHVGGRARGATGWAGRAGDRARRAAGTTRPLWRRLSTFGSAAFATARTHVSGAGRATARSGPRLSRDAGQAARATALRFAPRQARLDPQREAIRLNATGTQNRRHGRHAEAVECHRQALEILLGLGDRRGVALTQSNLALALSHSGDDEWAIGLFEEAAATLRDLGDEEHEGQVMANLGLVHRRHGRREEGDNVLELALAKLSPASSAYHAVEAELQRAS
jgi:hypothetical protein